MIRIWCTASLAAAACAIVLVVSSVRPAAAQEAIPLTSSFESLPEFVHVGSGVMVVTPQGRTAAGRVIAISPSSIVIDDGGPVTFRAQYVAQVYGEPGRRPVWRGTKIGLWSGVVLAVAIALEAAAQDECAPDECFTGTDVLAASLMLPAMGAGIGAGIGLMIPGKRTLIYRAPRAASVSLAPVGGGGQRGLAVRVTF
jgi:hypothetical protein